MTIVGLDLETTALSPNEGEIIEVAAIRFDSTTGQELGRFTHVLQSHYPISDEITALTGITPEMVKDKPFFKEIISDLKKFIGDDTIIAHNASFDIGWLAAHDLHLDNPVWDTLHLAELAWPEAPTYNLGSLARLLGISIDIEHRATADVLLTAALFQKAKNNLSISSAALPTVRGLLAKMGLTNYDPLLSTSVSPPSSPSGSTTHISNQPLPVLADILGENGLLQKRMTGFSPRPAQEEMANYVADILDQHGVGLVEADTGIGKTYGYLVPCIVTAGAPKPQRKIIVSTYTRHLQDQLVHTDIPQLLGALGMSREVAILKGRANYVCEQRLQRMLQRPVVSKDEGWVLLKLLYWLDRGGSGDLEYIQLPPTGYFLRRHLHADSSLCRLTCSPSSNCPYQRARRAAKRADILVINHALFAHWSGAGIDEEKPYLVIDEAHHLVEAIRQSQAADFSPDYIHEVGESFKKYLNEEQHSHVLADLSQLDEHYGSFLSQAAHFVKKHALHSNRLLLTPGLRESQAWKKVDHEGKLFLSQLNFIIGFIKGQLAHLPHEKHDACLEDITEAERLINGLRLFIAGHPERIQWIEASPLQKNRSEVRIHLYDLPLDVRPILAPVFGQGEATILTSATLMTGGNFGYIKNQIGINSASEKKISSALPYRDHMLIYIVEDSPNPREPQFDAYTSTVIENIAHILKGKILALCTSNKAVDHIYHLLLKRLHAKAINLYAQRFSGSRQMIQKFRLGRASVLLGTSGLWEGIDIPGEALSAVIIPKLPFLPPDDPIGTAIAHEMGERMFVAVSLPQMLIKLRQGVGRLLRSTTDRGVVVILDSRILTVDYRKEVMQSLPPATIRIGKKDELLPTIRTWFGETTLAKWEKEFLITKK